MRRVVGVKEVVIFIALIISIVRYIPGVMLVGLGL